MKLILAANGDERSIEILAPAPDCRFQLGGEAERSAHVEAPEPGVYSVLMDGRSYDARVEEVPGALVVTIDGFRFEVEVRDPRRWARKSARAGTAGVQSVITPMPGKVVKVLVAPGDEVAAGQGILVVEAMKMQNEMKAVRAGTVLSLAAKEGASVAAGAVLATIG